MKRFLSLLSLLLLIASAAAMYLIPLVWQPEPLFVFELGVGAAAFAILLSLALLLQLGLLIHEWSARGAASRVAQDLEEAHHQFLRRLDHELKNPLTGLQAALTNLREARDAAETGAALENASQAASRLGGILKDLRKLAELDALMIERRRVDVGELVEEMVNAASSPPAYQGRSVNLLVSKVPSLPQVTGDRDLLGLAIFNLIDNSLKFSEASQAVEVRVREDGRALFIEIADNGAGIPLQEQPRIFEDFYRGENARGTQGSGLGLALARRIIQLHGGEISLRSNPSQGPGAVFTIRLPAG